MAGGALLEPHSEALASEALALHSAVRMAASAASGSSAAASKAFVRTPGGARRAREAQMLPQRAWTAASKVSAASSASRLVRVRVRVRVRG